MGDGLYHAEVATVQELPRHLRNGAAVAPLITVGLPPRAALRLARIIEEQADAPIAVVEVERAPSRFDWFFWTLLLSQAVWGLIDDPVTVAAAYFTGLFHG